VGRPILPTTLDTWRRKDEIQELSQFHQSPYQLDKHNPLEEVIDLHHSKKNTIFPWGLCNPCA